MIYNDHSDDLTTNVKLFADDTSLFSLAYNMNTSTINLNNDLNKIKNWAIQWKMNFSHRSWLTSSGSYIFKKASKDKS